MAGRVGQEQELGTPLEQGEEDLKQDERNAHHSPHKCTDVLCLVIFAVGLVGMGFIAEYCSRKSDIRRLYHGFNWHGELCGVDRNVVDKPYLYWCTEASDSALDPDALQTAAVQAALGTGGDASALTGAHAVLSSINSLDLTHPICVQECPSSAESFHSCYQEQSHTSSQPLVTGTFWQNITYHFSFIQDVPTVPIAHRYCVPSDPALLEQLESTLQSSANAALFAFSQVYSAWPVLAASAVLGLVLGYAYLLGVKWLAKPILYLSITLAALVPFLCGLAGLYGAYQTEIHGHAEAFAARYNQTLDVSQHYVPSTGSQEWDVGISCGLIALSLLVCIGACCAKKSIELVLASIEATCDCLWSMPGLLLLPFAHAVIRMALLALAFVGLGYVLATGEVQRYQITDHIPAGMTRSFSYTDDEKLMIAGYIFMAAWIIEIEKAVESFVFSYCTQLWFFNQQRTGLFVVPRAYFVAYLYHLGTMAFGGFILALFSLAYFVLSQFYAKMKQEAGQDEAKNKVVDCMASCCCCCLQCWEKLVRFINKNTYIVVAISSQGFCQASQTALSICASEAAAIGLLEGATVFFQVCGMTSITGVGTYLAYLAASRYHMFADPSSEYFTPNPEFVTGAAAVILLAISWTFMNVFDVVSDTILFCWAYDKRKQEEGAGRPPQNLPPSLQKLLGDQRQDSARQPLMYQSGKPLKG